MKTPFSDAPPTFTVGDTKVVGSMTARFFGALLVLGLVAGILISTRLYPPAAVGAVVASIALAARLALASSGRVD